MKQITKKLFLGILLFIFSFENCFALDDALCHDANVLKAFRILGVVIFIIKILVPVVIIITGIISLAKAVMMEDESAVKKSADVLFKKVIVGVLIAFIPTIVDVFISSVSAADKTRSKFTECGRCLTSIKECKNMIGRYK